MVRNAAGDTLQVQPSDLFINTLPPPHKEEDDKRAQTPAESHVHA